MTSDALHVGFKNGGELIDQESGFYQISFKESLKAPASTLNIKVINQNITNCSRIVNFELLISS